MDDGRTDGEGVRRGRCKRCTQQDCPRYYSPCPPDINCMVFLLSSFFGGILLIFFFFFFFFWLIFVKFLIFLSFLLFRCVDVHLMSIAYLEKGKRRNKRNNRNSNTKLLTYMNMREKWRKKWREEMEMESGGSCLPFSLWHHCYVMIVLVFIKLLMLVKKVSLFSHAILSVFVYIVCVCGWVSMIYVLY